MSVLPSQSSVVYELDHHRYDLRQLEKAVRDTLRIRTALGAPPPTASTSSLDTSLFHLSTLNLDFALRPPEPWEQRYNAPPRANPAHEMFDLMRTSLSTAIDPMTPLTLQPPTRGLIDAGKNEGYYSYQRGLVNVLLHPLYQPRPILRIKDLPVQAAKEWMPHSSAQDMQHWLTAILALDPDLSPSRKVKYRDSLKRFFMETEVKICWVPDGEGAGSGIEIKILVTVEVFADWKAITTPLPEIGRDMLGLILHSLIPSPTPSRQLSESKARAQALQYFFTCLQPAPDHPLHFNASSLQPAEMKSSLLPFQARTLRLLLQREGSNIVPPLPQQANQDPRGFWETYDIEGHGQIAFRRTTGDIVHTARDESDQGKGKAVDKNIIQSAKLPCVVDLSNVQGTMLCEEMGLGKTIEAMALVMLHAHPRSIPRTTNSHLSIANAVKVEIPAGHEMVDDQAGIVPVIDLLRGAPLPEDRDSAMEYAEWLAAEKEAFEGATAWDEEAKLSVTEVGATLIVTPPSLLKQWVSEMRRHAPELRVCVYEGWKSLQKGIGKTRAARIKAREAKSAKRKLAEYMKVKAKYRKSNRGSRVKKDPDEETSEDEEEEQDDDEETSLHFCQRKFVEYVRAHDVVVTTYNDLSSDLKVALPAPPRARRTNAAYGLEERPRSPLVMVEWWRVIMDEVQLHGDSSDAANMVSLIPRRHSLAVSGTPARNDIKDLMGSLKFLRVPVIPKDNRLWHRLQQPSMRFSFEGLFQSLAVRTTKKAVAGEFNLPRQSRYVVPIELSPVEVAYYNDTLDRQRELLHLPHDDIAVRDPDWVLDRALFRSCLVHLRQICTHLQVGQLNAGPGIRAERLNLGRQLMTMTEALDKMKNDHSQEFISESRAQMRLMIRKAQLMMLKEDDDTRFDNACLQYTKVRERINAQIGPMRQHLVQLLANRRAGRDEGGSSVDSDDEDVRDRGLSQHQREAVATINAARQSVRETLLIEHQCWFFEGDVHHIRKEVEAETDCYEKAEAVRRELLSNPLRVANSSVDRLEKQLSKEKAIRHASDLQDKNTSMPSGIFSQDAVSQANSLVKILNGQAELVYAWRNKIIAALSAKIESEATDPQSGPDVEDPEKEYYAEALNAQGEIEALLNAYAAVIADRREFLLEERSLLAEHDDRGKKTRTTVAAKQAQEDVEEEAQGEIEEQTAALMQERQAFRKARDIKQCKRPMKGLLIDLNAIARGDYRAEELAIARSAATHIKNYIERQVLYVKSLSSELDSFRELFNRRVLYFKALQEISDLVTAPETKDVNRDILDCTKDIADLEVKLGRMVVKGRYLQYLGTKTGDQDDELRDDCIICMGSSDDSKGVLLECGHFFCQSCFKEYRKSMMGRKCPSCRAEIDTRAIKNVKLAGAAPMKSQEGNPALGATSSMDDIPASQEAEQSVGVSDAETERQRRQDDLAQLKYVDLSLLREVNSIDMMGEYGSKINFLVKHLMWFLAREPETRHVIFSNWSDSMRIVERALRENRISYTSFDQGTKTKDVVDQFIRHADISVFLLHAERESSGLTLTSCRVVHLLEPVLQHSFELQAIGRVDRLGQKRETEVYCYATLETVESRILSQGVRNGTSIYLKDEDADTVVASMPNVVSSAHKGGDLFTGNEEELLKLIL
ncbi:SNF2 family N-terminal domain-domain-containing protein [Kockovaella imperatae]|uniref:SNF2 family N-terminal domain-domain-containing protein n=1 Tax=Kockovaella imperatae TaxID=4999 RepID=A0A1Y1UA11_9TREE|nr:SNF2 family N-terminal domain-domain-containing protein [Kockovaella imperatae]ORX34384.1 SNF2 family N-terminal domain-domain-containing protein [Kockovaella imperatae]